VSKKNEKRDRGLVIKGATGPVHLGKGDIVENTVVISGPGALVIKGDNKRGISRNFD